MTSIRTPLAKVRGLGSAKTGTHEFIVQRVTSVALAILLTGFLILIVSLVGLDYAAAYDRLAAPPYALLMVAGLLVTIVHMRIGMQVIIEDYVHNEMVKIVLLILNWLFSWGVGLLAIFSVLSIAFRGA
jgi:succinate dehydrogenase / fumarate reductase membrane anchor subunit